jgi:hypothetical protein
MDLRQLPPTTTARYAESGLSRRQVSDALARGDVLQVGKGVVVGADRLPVEETPESHAVRVGAALARMRGIAAGSHGSAALLHAFSRLGRPTTQVRLTRGGGRYRRLAIDARIHVAGLPPEHLTTAHGVVVTTQARTVVDLARTTSFRGGVVIADSALANGCRPEDIDDVLAYCGRWPGRRRAVKVAQFASPLAESPLESVSRVLFHEQGLPEPILQHEIDVTTDLTYRVDFYWQDYGVIGEADGLVKYDDPDVLRREKVRELQLEDMGYEVVRWTWQQVWRQPDLVVAKLRRAMQRQTHRRTG